MDPVMDHIPALPLPVDGDGGPGGHPGHDAGLPVRPGPEQQAAGMALRALADDKYTHNAAEVSNE